MSSEIIDRLIEESAAFEHTGQVGVAMERARHALELAQSSGNHESIARTLAFLGDFHYRLGHFEEVRKLGEQALTYAGRLSPSRVSALILLGNCSMEVGSLGESEAYYQAAADLSRQIGDNHALVGALHDLGACVYALRGQFDLAFAAEEEAYRLACQLNSQLRPFMLISMCWYSFLTGQFQRARDILNQLLPLVAENYRLQGYYSWLCGCLAQLEGDLSAAFELYTQVRPVAETTGDLGMNVFLRVGLSICHQMAGNISAAYDWANDAVAWASRSGTRRLLGRALIERGRSAWMKGDLSGAESDLRLAIQDLSTRQQAYDLARAYLVLAALQYQQAIPEAVATYIEAISLIVSGGFTYLLERERALAFPLVAHFLNHSDPFMQAVNVTLLARLECVPPPLLRIITLGRFEVFRQGMAIPTKAWQRKGGELFRLLLISTGRTLSREQIIDALWPEKPTSTATVFFHQATSALRRALEPDLPDKFPSRYLLVDEGQVSLYLPTGSQLDYETFEAHMQKGECKAALQLYQGEPFPKDRYHDWASWKREQLIQLGLKTLLAAAAQSLKDDNAEQALVSCQRILTEEAWHEQATLLGMQACLKLNNRTGALRLYLDLERCLRQEFSILPMPELRELYQSLVKND